MKAHDDNLKTIKTYKSMHETIGQRRMQASLTVRNGAPLENT